jgi:general secretion pathway protein K
MNLPIRQRGAVVIVAMLVVALAATAASLMLQQQDAAIRQLEAARDYEQARWLLHGGAQWARVILRADARSSAIDHGGELWASGLPPTDIEQGRLSGEIRDQQGLFNLNNLVRDGKSSARDIAIFKRLLQTIGLRVDLADAITDWIDEDSDPQSSDGAEDAYYLNLAAPYRTANQPLSAIEEILRVRGCDTATVALLRRFATVLPRRTPVNVNMAPPEVLVAIVDGLTLPEAQVLASNRRTAPFQGRDDFKARLPRTELNTDNEDVSVDTQFFLIQGRAKVGKADLRMQALVQRNGVTLPSIVWQRMS